MKIEEGLKNVIALTSKICRIDGEKGILEYRGYNIHDLVKYSNFEEVVFLLLYGKLPSKGEFNDFLKELSEKRELPIEIIKLLKVLPKYTHPMVILRTAISYLGSLDKKLHVISREENLEKAKSLVAKIPTIIAYSKRIIDKKPLVPPKKNLTLAGNFLWMLKGKKASEFEEKALDSDLILHAEHGLNASTFAARIAASTLSDFYAGIVSATGVLMGSIHGGAAQKTVEMFRELRNEKKLSSFVEEKLKRKEKIPGFGHRVYKTTDPRAKEIRRIAQKLVKIRKKEWMFSLADRLAEELWKKKNLYPNVDFYAPLIYVSLGIPDKFFINIFAMARIAGWSAHLIEQYENNVLIRPLQKYVGESKKYIPLEKRN
jgi:citrate synthase